MKSIYGNMSGILSGFFWGLSGLLLGLLFIDDKLVSKNLIFIPIIIAFLNDFIAAWYMFVFLGIRKKLKEAFYSMRGNKKFIIFLAAICGGPIGMGFYVLSIKYIGVGYAATITSAYPVFGAISALLFLKDRINLVGTIGVLISLIATIALGYIVGAHSGFGFVGVIFAIIGALGWAAEIILSSYGMRKEISPDIAYFFRQVFSSIGYIIVILMFFQTEFTTTIFILFSSKYLIILMLIIALTCALSYFFYYLAIDIIKPIKAMGLNITYAAWGVFLGWLIVGDKVTLNLVILCMLVMFGSFLTSLSKLKIDE